MKNISALALILALGGCASATTHREMIIAPADGSTPGRFAFQLGVNAGPVEIDLAGEHLSGDWVYVADSGGIGRTATIVPTASGPRLMSSVQRIGATAGSGHINLRSSSGLFVQCDFRFSFDSGTGSGACLDDRQRRYTTTMFTVVGR